MRHTTPGNTSADGSWNSQPTEQQAPFHYTPPPDTPGQRDNSFYGSLADDTPTLVPGVPVSAGQPSQAPARRRRGVSRRAVLIGAGAGAVGIGAIGAGLGFALPQNKPATHGNIFSSESEQISHLLRRAGFGPSPADLGDYLNLGFSAPWIACMNPSSVAMTPSTRGSTP